MFIVPETDVLAPEQYFSHFSGGALEPEKRLMLAVLEDAIECLQNYAQARDGIRERLFFEAREWIWALDKEWPFSFENICDALELDPNYLRSGLVKKHPLLCQSLGRESRLPCRSQPDRAQDKFFNNA